MIIQTSCCLNLNAFTFPTHKHILYITEQHTCQVSQIRDAGVLRQSK